MIAVKNNEPEEIGFWKYNLKRSPKEKLFT